jgi:acylphosphatase
MKLAQKIVVKGRVQGVFFRKYTQQKAIELGVTGYVLNQKDASVLIWAEGSKEQLAALVKWCWHGSPLSSVKEVLPILVEPESFQSFDIKPT